MFSKCFLFSILFLSIYCTLTFDNIFVLNDSTLQKTVFDPKENETEWILIFYAEGIETFISNLKRTVGLYYEPKGNHFKFGDIDCSLDENYFLTHRFNITTIPYIVLITEGRMYEYNGKMDPERVLDFIDSQKSINESLPIPPELSLWREIKIRLNLFLLQFGVSVQNLLDRKNINLKWNIKYTYGVFASYIIIMILLVYFTISNYPSIKDYKKTPKKDKNGEKSKEKEKESKNELKKEDNQKGNKNNEIKEKTNENQKGGKKKKGKKFKKD